MSTTSYISVFSANQGQKRWQEVSSVVGPTENSVNFSRKICHLVTTIVRANLDAVWITKRYFWYTESQQATLSNWRVRFYERFLILHRKFTHCPHQFLQKPSPSAAFIHGAFAPSFIWCRRIWPLVIFGNFFLINEAIASRVTIVIVHGSDVRAESNAFEAN